MGGTPQVGNWGIWLSHDQKMGLKYVEIRELHMYKYQIVSKCIKYIVLCIIMCVYIYIYQSYISILKKKRKTMLELGAMWFAKSNSTVGGLATCGARGVIQACALS